MVVCRFSATCDQYVRATQRPILISTGRLPNYLFSLAMPHPARRALCGASSAIDPEALLSLSEAFLKSILQSIIKTSNGIQALLSIIV